MPIAVDGTSRHEASYVRCTLGETSSPNQLGAGGYLGVARRATLYSAARQLDFDQQLGDASKVVFKNFVGC